jgi:hypothetical protein
MRIFHEELCVVVGVCGELGNSLMMIMSAMEQMAVFAGKY